MAGKTVGDNDKYSNEEAQRRFEAALRGAREVGHEQMKDIPQKRPMPPKLRRKMKKLSDRE